MQINKTIWWQFSVQAICLMVLGMLVVVPSQAQTDYCANVTEISGHECSALVALYENTNQSGWSQRTNWLLTETPCDWYGVTCQDGHVTMLALSNNDLTGTVPAEIGNLKYLEVLDLAENNLTGHLPPEIANLPQLTWLYLNDNPLSGHLPTALVKLDKLEKLWLYNTNLCEPAQSSLDMWLNNLADSQRSGLLCTAQATTASINIAPTSQMIDCDTVTEISTEECAALSALYSSTNGAEWTDNSDWLQTDTPCAWASVTCQDNQVTELNLADNNLQGQLPAELGDLAALKTLTLDNNKLSGPLPGTLTNLNLDTLTLDGTELCMPQNKMIQDWADNIGVDTGNIPTCDTVSISAVMTDTMTITDTMIITAISVDVEVMTETMTTADLVVANEATSMEEVSDDDVEIPTETTTIADEEDNMSASSEADTKASATADDEAETDATSKSTAELATSSTDETDPKVDNAAAFASPEEAMPQSGGVLPTKQFGIIVAGLVMLTLIVGGSFIVSREE